MKRALLLVVVVLGVMTTQVSLAQDKSNTKSSLTEGYKELLSEVIAYLQLGNQDVYLFMAVKVDSLVRACYAEDAVLILDAQLANVAEGTIKRPRLSHEKVDGKTVLPRSVIRSYDKGFAKFLASLPGGVKKQSFETLVEKDKRIIIKPKAKIIRQYKKDLKKILKVRY